MENISKYITYSEATKSNTAIKNNIDNTPNAVQLAAMKAVGINVFDKVRSHFNKPIGVSSFFRSEKLNKKVGGSSASDHKDGEAIDIDADIFGGVTNKEIFEYIKNNLEFDKMIWEFGNDNEPAWVHVSYVKGKNRKLCLKAVKVNGKTKYINFE